MSSPSRKTRRSAKLLNEDMDTGTSPKDVILSSLYDLIVSVKNEIEEIKSNMADKEDIREIKTRLDTVEHNLQDTMDKADFAVAKAKEVDQNAVDLKTEFERNQRNLSEMRQQHAQLMTKVNSMEEYSRRENLIFEGIPYTAGENCSKKSEKKF